MSVPNTPMVNDGSLYVNGLQLAWNSVSTLTLASGFARDSSNVNDIYLPQQYSAGSPVVQNGLPLGATINKAVLGANGVDTGVIANNTLYAVYVIASSTSVYTSANTLGQGVSPNPRGPAAQPAPANPYPPAGLLSLASNALPYLPFGYDMYRRVGWAVTDSAGNFAKFYQYAQNDQTRPYYWDVGVSVLAAGAAATFTSVALNTNLSPGAGIAGVAVPPQALQVLFDVSLSAAGTAQFRPFGSTASVGQVRFGAAGAATGSEVIPSQLNAGVPTIQYLVSAGSVSLLVTGFVDLI